MTELRAPGGKDVTLPAITHNVQTEAAYRAALKKAVATMTASYEWWVSAKYRAALAEEVGAGVLPDLAQDAKAKDPKGTDKVIDELGRLRDYWARYFKDLSLNLAETTVKAWYRDNTTTWNTKLSKAGFDIKLVMTPQQEVFMKTKIAENVALIKSIQESYHTEIEGIVMRSFSAGRELSTMAAKIKERGGVSTRRAAFIANDQANKATAQLNAARQRELGITRAVWIHSSAGKEPRPSHVAAGREKREFDTQIGIDFHDGFGYVRPGEAINCRCKSRSIIPGIDTA